MLIFSVLECTHVSAGLWSAGEGIGFPGRDPGDCQLPGRVLEIELWYYTRALHPLNFRAKSSDSDSITIL